MNNTSLSSDTFDISFRAIVLMYLSFKFPLLYSSAGTILRIFLMKRLSSIKFEFIYWASYIAGIRNEKASARFSMLVFNVQRSTFMVDWEVFGIRSKVEQPIYGLSVVFFCLFSILFSVNFNI